MPFNMEMWKVCIHQLQSLLNSKPQLQQALEQAIKKAGYNNVQTLQQYYDFLEGLLTEIPVQRTMSSLATQFHYILSCAPGDSLKKDESFRSWLVEFSRSHGSFLDTTASAACLDTFVNNPGYHIDDYYSGPSGWLTFNQFFARPVKPGRRPIEEPHNNSTVVAAADSVYLGCWPIDSNSSITAKGVTYPVAGLLEGSPYKDVFKGGVFTHSYLDSNDYHRYHTPVEGIIREVRNIPGDVVVKAVKKEDGKIETTDEEGFQFTQTRGLIIIESPVGFVAVLPIGMGHVSSVNLTVENGAALLKGQEFGYFCYGGSDMVMLFQAGSVAFTATTGKHYNQGQMIAKAAERSGGSRNVIPGNENIFSTRNKEQLS
jgi:phosphatidylserine decarboxylase precursor